MATALKAKEFPFFELYDKFIYDSKTGRRLQPNGKIISSGTIDNYRYTGKLLHEFCREKQFQLRIRPVKYLNKRDLMTEKNYWRKFYKKFTDYLYIDCGHFDNYVGQNTKNIRVFFNYLNKDLMLGIGEFHKSFYTRKEEIPIVTLLPEELNFIIYDKDFEMGLSKRLQQAKDVFVFGSTVALRISDLLALKRTHLRIVGGTYYLVVRSKKTNTDTQIRLPDYAVAIIDKYHNKHKTLLPPFNKVNLNLYLKELMEKAGFTHPVTKTRERRGKSREIVRATDDKRMTYRFCDLVTTHTMRRTAITTMLSLGVPEQVVRKISGHSPMSKEFFRYVAFAQAYQDQEVDKMFEKLKEKHLVVGV